MRFELLGRCPGLPHAFLGSVLLASRRNVLLETADLGRTWRRLGEVPGGLWDTHLCFRAAERLLRRSISNAVRTPEQGLLVVANRRIYRRGARSRDFVPTLTFEHGSRPMHRGLCVASNGSVYVGEYWGNAEREAVRILRSQDDGCTWRVAHVFEAGQIRHVHAIQEDPFRSGDLWILCGDLGGEPRFLRTRDDLATLEHVGGGDQSWRATSLVFTEQGLYYGMDSPLETSWLYRLERDGGQRVRITPVQGPVYYGYVNASNHVAFGTTVEPGPSVRDDRGRIWVSADGKDWDCVVELSRDRWPQPWFQYGCFYFPDGRGPDDLMVFGAVGLVPHEGHIVFGRLRDEPSREP